MVKDNILSNVDFLYFSACVECLKGKLVANVRNSKIGRCDGVFDLIHTNICGPFTPSFLGGYEYFITFTDDFSR